MKIYIDGNFYNREEAKISVFDHGLLYGDGIFEGIRIYNNTIFKLTEHIERLYASAKALMLNMELSPKEMEQAVIKTVSLNGRENGYIRLLVTRGVGDLGINPALCKKTSIIIIVDKIQVYPEESYEKGIKVITASTRRSSPQCFDPRIKSLNYLNNIMAKMEAIRAGCPEAVMLNTEGYVVECTADNLFIVNGEDIVTPSAALGALDGITKHIVLDFAQNRGVSAREAFMTLYDVYSADECFLTGTGAELIPVVEVDGRKIGKGKPGPLFKALLGDFRQMVA